MTREDLHNDMREEREHGEMMERAARDPETYGDWGLPTEMMLVSPYVYDAEHSFTAPVPITCPGCTQSGAHTFRADCADVPL